MTYIRLFIYTLAAFVQAARPTVYGNVNVPFNWRVDWNARRVGINPVRE